MRIFDLLDRDADLYPQRRAVVIDGHCAASYGELRRRAMALATALAHRGITAGDRVALLASNGLAFFDVYLAVSYLGAAAVPIGTRLTQGEIGWILDDSRPAICFVDSAHRHLVNDSAIEVVDIDDDRYAEMIATESHSLNSSNIPDDSIALLIYTSGTTGRPKGAALSQRALTFNALSMALIQNLVPDDVWLSITPLYHAAAASRVTTMLVDGQTHVVLPAFDAGACLRAIEEHAVTGLLAVPTQLGQLLDSPALHDADLSSLRLVVYGAAPTAADLIRRTRTELGVALYQGYGLSEAVTNLCALLPADHDHALSNDPGLLASCGRPVPGVQIELRDSGGTPVRGTDVGEIWARTDKMMNGYWRNADATAEAIQHGWLSTGDLARRDESGYLYLVGRSKDMLISGGVNVYPSEIEAVLERHPAVLEAAVVGKPDPKWGEVPVAFLRIRDGAVPDEEELGQLCRSELARMKVPVAFHAVDDYPRTATGKIRKNVLRSHLDSTPVPS
jgi:O-succinylbenzoate-CoA ligase